MIPPRNDILNSSKRIIFKKGKNQSDGAAIKKEWESEQIHDEESESEQNDDK